MRKKRTPSEETLRIILAARVIDDFFFEKVIESPEVCEELLQVVLENPNLRIKRETLVAQKSFRNLQGRSVRLDAYVEGFEDEVFNIEIQRADNCNHPKRVRYNAAVITANRLEPGDTFDDVQELYMIYITEFDFLHGGKTIYHAQTTVRETGGILQNGLHEVYVNTEHNDGSRIARLMKLMKEPQFDDVEFPMISKRVNELKNSPKEVDSMCKSVEEYANKKNRDLLFSLVENGDLSIEVVANRLQLSQLEVEQLMLEEGYQIPNLV